ncbi:hypothetical protein [Sphingomonas sp. PWP1-2]|uniref:hypothetical protein n=1 Tax=Sphingomonas sp. PWP1-2 TaxID=2804558 RepID=UPI003CF1FB37
MRRILLGLVACGIATPAFANESAPPPRQLPDAAQVGALLSSPLVQEIIATTVDQYADALLQTHVGPLAKLTDTRDHVRPEDTLGDLAARTHPDYRRDLHNQTRSAVAATGQAARDIASLSAELKHTTERLRAAIALTQAEVSAVR